MLQSLSHGDLPSQEGRFQGHVSGWPLGAGPQGEYRSFSMLALWLSYICVSGVMGMVFSLGCFYALAIKAVLTWILGCRLSLSAQAWTLQRWATLWLAVCSPLVHSVPTSAAWLHFSLGFQVGSEILSSLFSRWTYIRLNQSLEVFSVKIV